MSKKDYNPATDVDEFHGVGGSYVVENGKRKQVVKPTGPAEPPKATDTKPTDAATGDKE